ncbi:hypothetical protein ATCC90586_004000 [Pythium insidiosum]|nr:hypothetical protein ATCC90586_004000 [Pythium insidiosum]
MLRGVFRHQRLADAPSTTHDTSQDPLDAMAPGADVDELQAPPQRRYSRLRSQSETLGNGAESGAPPTASTAVPTTTGLAIPSARMRMFTSRRDRFQSSSSSDEDDAEMQMYSTSYAGPRDLTNFTFEMARMNGYLEKQSLKSPDLWKRRWFVMQENVLFYYKSEEDVRDGKPSDETCCGIIQLDSIDSVTTAKDFGVGAFQIRLPDRRYVLRADSKEVAATFTNEKLLTYLGEHEAFMSNARQAFSDCFRRIDEEFLQRAASESLSDGSTAAVVLIRGNKLLTANLGDSRAVVSINGTALDVIEEQTPGRADERSRIERCGGWIKEERELQMSKLHSMDLSDPRIQQKAERVVRWVTIYRVNGELAVSRAIGDIDYKGQALQDYEFWAFPEGHDRQFHGDLVTCEPEFKVG